tara:strand:- start:14745 stop:15551 length:807 start_codon:yes stop_codon:yes gene_type:complete
MLDSFVEGQFTWFIGTVEDVNDPEFLNRVKVRCYGYHTDQIEILKTEDLPFATVMMPNTTASFKGTGGNHELMVGSWVIGFFKDGPSAQDPVIMGTFASKTEGIIDTPVEAQLNPPTNKVHKTEAGHLIELDNTLDAERINIKHGKNTSTLNIDKDGITILQSTGVVTEEEEAKTHTLTLNPKENTINLLHSSGTTINISTEGSVTINAFDDIVNIDGNTTITGTLHVTEAQTNDKTITAQESITGKGIVLDTHTHTGDSGGTTGTPN